MPMFSGDDDAIRVTVFASSTPETAAVFVEAAAEFGRGAAQAGLVSVFGGGNAGCMGAFYKAVHATGGRLRGITHRMFVKPGGSSLSEENAAELESLEIVEGRDLTMRKRRLLDAGDCLVALPGGVGTFDELFMAIGERGLPNGGGLPVLVLNTNGYYDGALQQLQRAHKEGMLRKHWTDYAEVVTTPQAAVEWCSRQRRRARDAPPVATSPDAASSSSSVAYRQGIAHGLLLASAALVVAAAAGVRARRT